MFAVYWRRAMSLLLSGLIAFSLTLGLTSCGSDSQPPTRTGQNQSSAKVSPENRSEVVQRVTSTITEVSPPATLQELKLSLDRYQPQVQILSPQPDTILQDNTVAVQIQVRDLPLFKDARLEMGPHLHVILDNQPYRSVYDVSQPIVFTDLAAGTHTLRVFPVFPWHESFKNAGAYDQVTFHVFTKTDENNPSAKLPLLTYSRPKDTYGAEPILLDFYLTNAPLHQVAQENPNDEIRDWRIRVTINGSSFEVDRWQPLYLKGFQPGKNWIQLEFLDQDGKPVPNVFNRTTRIITYEPGGQDTLSKLVRGDLKAREVRAIVDPNLKGAAPFITSVPSPTQPEPVPSPSPSLSPSPVPIAKPSLAPTPSPTPFVEEPAVAQPEEIPLPEPKPSPEKPGFFNRFRLNSSKTATPAPSAVEPELEPTPTPEPSPSTSATPAAEKPLVEAPLVEELAPAQPTQPVPETTAKGPGFFNRFRLNSSKTATTPSTPSPAAPEVEPAPEPSPSASAEPTPVEEPPVPSQPAVPSEAVTETPSKQPGFFNRFLRVSPAETTAPSSELPAASPLPSPASSLEPSPAALPTEEPGVEPTEEPAIAPSDSPEVESPTQAVKSKLEGFFNRFRRSAAVEDGVSPTLLEEERIPAPTAPGETDSAQSVDNKSLEQSSGVTQPASAPKPVITLPTAPSISPIEAKPERIPEELNSPKTPIQVMPLSAGSPTTPKPVPAPAESIAQPDPKAKTSERDTAENQATVPLITPSPAAELPARYLKSATPQASGADSSAEVKSAPTVEAVEEES